MPEVIKVGVIPLVGESAGVSLLVLPFLISLPIISRILSREYGARQYSVAGLCAATFALSVDLLTLAAYEVAGILSPTSRHTAWRIVLGSLVVSLAGVLPFFACLLLAADAGLRGWRVRIATATAGTMLWLWLFWRAGALFPISARGDHDLLSLEGAVGRLGVAGVTTAALLSGWGAVANPYAYLTVPAASGVTDADVRAARRGVKDAADRSKDAAHRLARAERRSNEATSAAVSAAVPHSSSESTSSWLGSLFGSDGSGDGIAPEVLARRAEASIASDVAAEAVAEFRELSEARQRARGARTICGRSSAALGVILSIYCIYRVFMALANIVLHRDPTKDPVTRGLEVTLMAFEVPAATAAWFVQPASFLLVGVLAVGSIRGFLQSLARLASWGGARSGRGGGGGASSSVALDTISAAATTTTTTTTTTASVVVSTAAVAGFESPDVDEKTSPREALYGALSLLVAQLLGMYALSTLLLMRMSVPEEYRAGITRAVGDIHFNFFHRECGLRMFAEQVVTDLRDEILTSRLCSTRVLPTRGSFSAMPIWEQDSSHSPSIPHSSNFYSFLQVGLM